MWQNTGKNTACRRFIEAVRHNWTYPLHGSLAFNFFGAT